MSVPVSEKIVNEADLKVAYDALSDKIDSLTISIVGDNLTWSDVYDVLKDIPLNAPRNVYINGPQSLMTGGAITSTCKGIVTMVSDGAFDFMAMVGSGAVSKSMVTWRITGLISDSATPTVGSVTRYAGAPVSVLDGGTGGTTPETARDNLSAAAKIMLVSVSSDDPEAEIYGALNVLSVQQTASVYVAGSVMSILTNGKITAGAFGTVIKFNNSGLYRFFLARTNGQYIYGISCSITSSKITPGDVYQFNGTQI